MTTNVNVTYHAGIIKVHCMSQLNFRGRVDLKKFIVRPIALALVLVFSFMAVPLRHVAANEAVAAPVTDAPAQDAATEPPASSVIEPNEAVGVSDDSQASQATEESPEKLKEDAADDKKPKDPKEDDQQSQAAMAGNQESQSSSVVSNSTIKQIMPEPDLATGALAYSYPITVPPGRNGLAPTLVISYNSQNNTEGSLVGYGWNIDIPYIERLNKTGTNNLYTDNYFTSSLDGELISTGSGNYAPKVENGSFLKYALSSNVWTVTDKKGSVYKFGTSAAERQDNPNDTTKVYKWMLQEVRDTNNNYIKYEYYKDAGQIYPSKIKYTGNNVTDGLFEVEFLRQSRTDVTKSYHAAFAVTTSYRINEIQAKVSGTWVRKYALSYTTGDNGTRSMLSSITESGQKEDGTGSISKPAISFQYQTATASWTTDTSTYTAPVAFQDNQQQMLDLNGDGWVDIIESYYTSLGVSVRTTYLNNADGTWSSNGDYQAPTNRHFQKWETRGGSSTQYWDQGVRLTDVDGDQLPDMIESRGGTGGASSSYQNTGSGWSSRAAWVPSILFTSTADVNDYGTHTADINGDGLSDIIQNQGSSQNEQVNTGSDFGASGSSWTTATELTYPRYRVVDVNGDKLPDVLESYQASGAIHIKHAYINKGDGTWSQDDTWATPIKFTSDLNDTDFGVRFFDVNGDQLVDAVIDPVNENNGQGINTYLNNGYGWTSASSWNLPVGANELKSGYSRVTDINADGLTDFFSVNSTGVEQSLVHNGVVPDLLKKVTYPESGYTDITYKAAAKYKSGSTLLNPDVRLNLQTVETITNNDNFGTTSLYTYTYEGGKYYFNTALDRKPAGFHKVTRVDIAGNKQITYFHQGDSTNSSQGEYSDHASKIGKPYRVEYLDSSGNKYAVTINKWDKYNQGTGRDFSKLAQIISFTYDGNASHKDSAESFTYDDTNGNLTQKIDWGEVTGSDTGTFTDTGSDKFTTDIAYASNAGLYIIGLPKVETTIDQSSNKVRESKFYYDAQAHGSVTKGNLTKEEKWKTGSTYIDTEKTYSATYGVVLTEKDPRDKITTYTYDSYNLYPATVTNPLSQVTSFAYDYSSGKVKQTTDVNNLVFQTVYDGLDRIVEEKQPDQTTPATLVTKTTYTYTDTSGSVRVQKTDHLDGSTSVDTHTYFDGFHRPVQTRIERESADTFSVTDTVYNNIEQIYKESLPYSQAGSAKTSVTTNNALLTTYSYDPLYRVVSAVNNVGTTSTAFEDWKTSVTDPRGKVKHLYKDARGLLIKVEEINAGSTYTTQYEYDGNGNLKKITDALGNVRNFTYDGLSRRLTAQDLHASADATFGSWTYTYDDSGNLTSSLDPKSQTINYTYDDLNRKLAENFTGQAGTEVLYTYDTCTRGVGRLCQTEVVGTTLSQYQYSPTGQISQEYENTNSTGFTTSYTYDRQGNQLEITNPDGSKVKYAYNTAGQLETIQRKESTGSYTNVVTDFNYGPHGKITYQANANGTSTTNTYDYTKLWRLSDKDTVNGSGTKLQDLAYTYDANGNITKIIDASNTASSKTVDYTYDDLNRLLSATATNTASGQSTYTHTYTYDAVGNILTRSDGAGTYSYAGSSGSSYANPHAVTSIGSGNFTYDNNGNMLTAPASGGSSVPWYSGTGTWTDRKQIVVDETKIPGSTALTDFPLLVSVTDNALKTVANGGKVGKSDGTDILFTIDNSTKLSHEIEKYDGVAGTLVTWVKVPSLSATANTTIYTYFGNSSASDQQDITGTWGSNYKGVWHLHSDLLDATSNNNDGTNVNSTNGTGKMADGQSFDGVDDKVSVANSASLKPTSGLTLSGWIKRNGAQVSWAKPVWFGQNLSGPWGPYGFEFNDASDTQLNFHIASSSTSYDISSSTSLSDATWYYITGTYDGSNVRYYINGSSQGSTAATFTIGNYDTTYGLGIGDNAHSDSPFKGTIDELRVVDTVRSGDWITAEYNNQNSPSTFYSFGNVSTGGGSSSSYTYDFRNKLIQATVGTTTVEYGYDHSGQRVNTDDGTTATAYPTKYYSTDGTTAIKHILDTQGNVVATVKGSGGSAVVYTVHTDHLTGSNVVSTSAGAQEELMDYFPYGNIRLDQKAGTFSEKRKYAGHEYDSETGLSYMEARYYSGGIGRFLSQDPAYLGLGRLEVQLADPQSWNSYAYARNNPLKYNDPDGQFWDTVVDLGFTGYDAWKGLYHGTQTLGGYASQGVGKLIGHQGMENAGRQQASQASLHLKSDVKDVLFDAGATLVPGVPAFVGRTDDVAKVVKNVLPKADSFKFINTPEKIVEDHALTKHIWGEKSGFGSLIKTPEQATGYVKSVMENSNTIFRAPRGNIIYDNRLGGVIFDTITRPTFLQPRLGDINGKEYFLNAVRDSVQKNLRQ